jgi:hypothetical protein
MEKRKRIPQEIQDKILTSAQHCCCICGRSGTQLHHIDGNHNNNDIGNLAVLCPTHHAEVHGNMTKKITPTSLRRYMGRLLSNTKEGSEYIREFKRNFMDGIRTISTEEAIVRFFDLPVEIINFIYENKQDFEIINKEQKKHLLELYKSLAKVIRKFDLFLEGLETIEQLPSNKKLKFTNELTDEIRNFGKYLALVNLDLLDIYSPGLGKELLSLIHRDMDLFYYVATNCKQFEIGKESYKDYILALFAEHFNGDGYWELAFNIDYNEKLLKINELDKIAKNCIQKIKKCQALLQNLIKEFWRIN